MNSKWEEGNMPKVFGKKNVVEVTVTSYWPKWARRLFESLKEIPWLSLTAMGTLLGVLILFCYFQSIDHFPSDFSALISLGAATAVGAAGLSFVLALGLFFPAATYRDYASDDAAVHAETKRPFTEIELICLQLGGVGLTFALIAYAEYRDCGKLLTKYSVIAVCSLLFWLVACLRIVLSDGTRKQRARRLNASAGIAIFSSTLCLVFLPLLPVFTSEFLDSSVVFLTLWALAIIANASAAKNLPIPGLLFIGALIVGVLFIAMPIVTESESIFPKMVANLLGVRQEQAQDLRVPEKTCRLIQSAMGTSVSSADLKCEADDWGKVKAQILSNVGDQWMIELAVASAQDQSKTSKLRLTVPGADIQVVRLIEDKFPDAKKITCKK
jgi:hypothetical protein